METLDQRLYAWLAEPDESRFERAFNAYFSVAFPAVVRYLARLSSWDSVRVEDLAQESLLRFFDRARRGRRAAAETVTAALTRLHSLKLGTFHEREARAWVESVRAFVDAAMGFRNESGHSEAKGAIHALRGRIPMLERQGRQLLESVAAEERHPGVAAFCQDVAMVVDSLPHLRVPTNGFLFQIARNIFLDECKRHGRRKRGGAGQPLPDEIEAPHPFDSWDDRNVADEYGHDPAPAFATISVAPLAASVDPTPAYESEELFAKFYEYLRAPLDRAAEAYERASSTGHAVAERRRLDSLSSKFSRSIAVLSALGEGHTQEQIAEELGISRNQVKYIIELVQEAYVRFHAEEQSHVS